jgi:hypothetical protein
MELNLQYKCLEEPVVGGYTQILLQKFVFKLSSKTRYWRKYRSDEKRRRRRKELLDKFKERKDTGTRQQRNWIALSGEITMEESLNLCLCVADRGSKPITSDCRKVSKL